MKYSNMGYNPFGNTLEAYIQGAIKKAIKEMQSKSMIRFPIA